MDSVSPCAHGFTVGFWELADGFVKERLHALKESGVTSLNVSFAGKSATERVAQCDKLRNLVESM